MFSLKKLGTAGQATTEYILILVVVIALFTLIGGPLMQNLTSWGFKLVGPGGYYSCLMENGLLPGFKYTEEGGSVGCSSHKVEALGSITNEGEGILGGEGADKFQTARENTKEGGKGANGKGAKDGKGAKKKKSYKKKKPKRTKTSTLGSGNGGSSRGRKGPRAYAGRFKKTSRGTSSSQAGSESSSFEDSEEDDAETYSTGKKRTSRTKKKKRKTRRKRNGYLGFELPEEEQRPPSFKERFSNKKKGANRARNSRIQTKKRVERKIQSEEDVSFQFGDFLKYIFIAALIIILLVVGGSQILELKNKD